MEVGNTLAYYDAATITAVESFIAQDSGCLSLLTAVIVDVS